MRPAALVLVVAVACAGTSPRNPGATTTALETIFGTATIVTNGHAFDTTTARVAIEMGYIQAANDAPAALDVPVEGLLIVVDGELGVAGVYRAATDTLRIAPGTERILRHEMQHRLCGRLQRPAICCAEIDHPGGYGWNCLRMSGVPQA